jgi:hypothetical protein
LQARLYIRLYKSIGWTSNDHPDCVIENTVPVYSEAKLSSTLPQSIDDIKVAGGTVSAEDDTPDYDTTPPDEDYAIPSEVDAAPPEDDTQSPSTVCKSTGSHPREDAVPSVCGKREAEKENPGNPAETKTPRLAHRTAVIPGDDDEVNK